MNVKVDKSEIVKVNLSETFMVRSRCKSCGELPSIYYYFKNQILFEDANEIKHLFAFIKKYISRMCHDFYLIDSPSKFIYMSVFGFKTTPIGKSYNPKLHKMRSPWTVYQHFAEITDFLTCECGKTSWAFSAKSIQHRPEIVLRKSKHKYPTKIEY